MKLIMEVNTMLMNKRIKRATNKTVKLFNKKNHIRKEAEISIEALNLGWEFEGFLTKEIKELDKVSNRYEKAHNKLMKLQEKNHSRLSRISIAEA